MNYHSSSLDEEIFKDIRHKQSSVVLLWSKLQNYLTQDFTCMSIPESTFKVDGYRTLIISQAEKKIIKVFGKLLYTEKPPLKI